MSRCIIAFPRNIRSSKRFTLRVSLSASEMGRLEAELYRLLRQHARRLPSKCELIPSFDRRAWLAKQGSPTLTLPSERQTLAPEVLSGLETELGGLSDRIAEVRRRFREPGGTVERALDAIKALDEQRYLREKQRCHTTQAKAGEKTVGIKICSITEPVGDGDLLEYDEYDEDDEENVDRKKERYLCSYRITITNLSGASERHTRCSSFPGASMIPFLFSISTQGPFSGSHFRAGDRQRALQR